jgi:hypothetical protein
VRLLVRRASGAEGVGCGCEAGEGQRVGDGFGVVKTKVLYI